MRTIIQTVVIAVGIINIVLFGVWLSIIRVTALSNAEIVPTYRFDQISFQITVMQTFLGALAIILAIAAVFGFQMVIERADKTAREVVLQLERDGILGRGGNRSGGYGGTSSGGGGGTSAGSAGVGYASGGSGGTGTSPGPAPQSQGEEDI